MSHDNDPSGTRTGDCRSAAPQPATRGAEGGRRGTHFVAGSGSTFTESMP